MTWVRLKIAASKDGGAIGEERLFNLGQLQWWRGYGDVAELQYAGQAPVYVLLHDKRLELLTGASGNYGSDA